MISRHRRTLTDFSPRPWAGAAAATLIAVACAGEGPEPTTRAEPATNPNPDSAALAADSAAEGAGGDVVTTFRQRMPDDLLLRRGACPFECCIYREWQATGEIRVVAQERGTAPPVFTIDAGEAFRADSGNVHVTGVAIVPVTDSVGDPPYWSFRAGDTLVVLDYVGEGFYNVWHDGRVVEVPTFWTDGPIEEGDGSIGEHSTEWWVHITTRDGRTGWIRADTAPQISGVDACG